MEESKKPLSLIEKIKAKAKKQKSYGGDYLGEEAKINTITCSNCGAGRAKEDGLTKCAYCNFEFLAVKISKGINLSESDNSK